ncbi:MAG TPA: hypothetical protein VGC42_13280 [Kofleriaceae bacterium]
MSGCAVDVGPDTDEASGESSGSGGGSGSAKTPPNPSVTYDNQVKPNVQTCIGCHSNHGPQPDLTSYSTLAAKYKTPPGASSPLVTKGAHEGPALTQFQANAIIGWINSLAVDPSQSFDSQIKPIVSRECVACHSGGQPPNLTSYAALESPYKVKPGASNPLVTKGLHEGPTFTATERTTVINWIDSLPAPDPAQTYDTQVKPIFQLNCSPCHGGTASAPPPNFTSYATLAAKYKVKPAANNPLITKGIHEGPALSAAQQSVVASWINSLP